MVFNAYCTGFAQLIPTPLLKPNATPFIFIVDACPELFHDNILNYFVPNL